MNTPPTPSMQRGSARPFAAALGRHWLGLAMVVAIGACDTEDPGPSEPMGESEALEASGGDGDVSFRDSYCDIVVNVSGCKGNFVNGVYRWDTTKGYHLEKDWEDYVFQSFVKPSEDQVNHWAIVYEGFHRNGDWHPAYTEVFVAESPGGLPNTATWPDGVIVRCDY